MSNCKRNAAVGLLVASTCLSGLFGYQGNTLSKANKELKQNVMEQAETINKLSSDYGKLESNYNMNEKSLKELEQKYEKEIKEKEDLIQKNADLAAENEKLVSAARARQLRRAAETKKKNETSSKPVSSSSNTKISLSASELNLLERLVECEAGAEPTEGQIAVVNVVLNRRRSGQFPNTITGVIYDKGQFSPVASGFINNVTVSSRVKSSVRRALDGETVVSNDTLYFFATWVSADNPIRNHVTVTKTIGGHHFGK